MRRWWLAAQRKRCRSDNNLALHLTAPITVAVLAGGQSRRMGRDKAAINVDGMPLLERVCRAASGAGLPVIVVGREVSALPRNVGLNYSAIPDDLPGSGALGGLATALRHAPGSSILLCATDLTRVRPEDFEWLSAQAAAGSGRNSDGVVPVWQGRPEPLFAIYHQSILSLANQRLGTGELAMHGLITAGNFQLLPLPECNAGAVFDVDTPEDLRNLNITDNLDDPTE